MLRITVFETNHILGDKRSIIYFDENRRSWSKQIILLLSGKLSNLIFFIDQIFNSVL